MIPDFVDGRLPAGEWAASWEELEAAFATSQWRRHLLDGCRRALASLHVAGCDRAWIDGSFVASKRHPGDIDACYDSIGVDGSRLHPAPLDLSPGRPEQFVEFFQRARDGRPKGIVVIDLKSEEFGP